MDNFSLEKKQRIEQMSQNNQLMQISKDWYIEATRNMYSYQFTWLGVPIIQFPQDILAMQEIIFQIKPDLIIETGIARGGSLIFYASMLALLGSPSAKILGIDIDIRQHTKDAINNHPLKNYIDMIEGSSITNKTKHQVYDYAANFNTIMVALDSNHTKQHVLEELSIYSKLVSKNSYLIVFDTSIALAPDDLNQDRPWSVENGPLQAVDEFLLNSNKFTIDNEIQNKLLVTECFNGYLKRVY